MNRYTHYVKNWWHTDPICVHCGEYRGKHLGLDLNCPDWKTAKDVEKDMKNDKQEHLLKQIDDSHRALGKSVTEAIQIALDKRTEECAQLVDRYSKAIHLDMTVTCDDLAAEIRKLKGKR